jgi:putative nucleotidyltransferase with HDIG domain
MSERVKRVPIENVKIGMYVADVFNDKGTLLFSADTPITQPSQINSLIKRGVTAVYIDIAKSKDSGEGHPPAEPDVLGPEDLGEQLRKVETHYGDAIETAREAMESARMGRLFSIKSIEHAAIRVVDSVKDDPMLLLTLCQIKRFSTDLYSHSVNVCIMVSALCHAMGYTEDQILLGGVGGLLHDIGKMRVPPHLLLKPGRYSRQEREAMNRHPEYGMEIVDKSYSVSELSRNVIGQHHERINGKGYPRNLKRSQIAEIAQIGAIADVYDALTTDKPYRPAFLPQEALALIFQGSDEEFPRDFVEHFAKLLGIYPVGSFVKLDSGEMGVVIRINRDRLLEPTVMVLFDPKGRLLETPRVRDLAHSNRTREAAEIRRIQRSLNPKEYGIDPSKAVLQALQGTV